MVTKPLIQASAIYTCRMTEILMAGWWGKIYFDGSGIQLILGSGVQDSFKIESEIGKKLIIIVIIIMVLL